MFDYRPGRENNGRRFGPRFPGIPASHQNVCSGVRSGQVTGRPMRRPGMWIRLHVAVRHSRVCLPIGWTPQDSFCVSGRPRTHGGAATVPVPFHGVPNGPKLPWGRSERGRTSVQRALIKLWPAFFSPSSFKCIRESNVISGFALRSKVGRCSRPPEALSWLAATKKGLPHSTSRPKSRNLFATFFSSKFICSTGKKLPTKKKPSSIREHFPFKRNGP